MAQRNETAKTTIYLDGKQAESVIDGLKLRASQLTEQLEAAKSAGDLELASKIKKELAGVDSAINSSKKELFDYGKVLRDINGTSLKDLYRAKDILYRKVLSLKTGTEEWIAANNDLQKVKTKIADVSHQMSLTQSPLQKVIGFAKDLLPAFSFAAIAAAAKLAFDKIVASTDTLSTKWAVFMGGMKGATDEFFRTLATGNWDGFVTNMRNAIEVGREYERMLDDIEAKQRALSIAESDAKEEIVKLEEDLRNKGLTNEQRLASGKRRIAIEEELALKRSKITKQGYDNEVMMAKQASKLSDEKLQQLVRDLDSEKKIKAEAYNALQDELKKLEARASQGGASTGVLYPGMQSNSGYSAAIAGIKKQMDDFSPDVVSYATDLRLLGNVTDEQLNKMVAAYGKFKDAEVSGRESIKRVITMVNSLQATENKTGGDSDSGKSKPSPKTDFSDVSSKVEQNIRIQEMKEQMDIEAQMEAERLAGKKASEEEWTKFFEDQIQQRTDAEAAALEIEKEIADARIALKDLQVDAIGQLASTMAGMFEQGSVAQIAMMAVEKGAAIAQIIFNTAVANAKAVAMSPLTAGQPWVAINTVSAAASIAGIVATTISSFKDKKNNDKPGFSDGGSTGPGSKYDVKGVVHAEEYVIPMEGTQNPKLKPVIDLIEIARRNGTLARLDLRPIVQMVGAKSLAVGGHSSTYGPGSLPINMPASGNTGLDPATANRLIAALEAFEKKKLVVYTELIKKDLETLEEIDNKR